MTTQFNNHRQVAFSGYYGMSNFGDDLFGAICAQMATQNWQASVEIVGPPIQGVAASYTIPFAVNSHRYASSNLLGASLRLGAFLRAIARADIFVFGGGSTISDAISYRRQLLRLLGQAKRLEIGAVGVSLGPFTRDPAPKEVAGFLRSFAHLATRDDRSYEVACKLGLQATTYQGRDIAGVLPSLNPLPAAHSRSQAPQLGVALCDYREDAHAPGKEDVLESVAEAVALEATARGIEVRAFSLCAHQTTGDRALTERFVAMLRHRGIAASVRHYDGAAPFEFARELASTHALISARLHGAITAYVYGVPFGMIDYHPKCRDFCDDIGLPKELRITRQRNSLQEVRETIRLLLDDRVRASTPPENFHTKALGAFRTSPWWQA